MRWGNVVAPLLALAMVLSFLSVMAVAEESGGRGLEKVIERLESLDARLRKYLEGLNETVREKYIPLLDEARGHLEKARRLLEQGLFNETLAEVRKAGGIYKQVVKELGLGKAVGRAVGRRLGARIARDFRILKRIDGIIDRLANRGVDVTKIHALIGAAEAKLREARGKLSRGEVGKAFELVREAEELLRKAAEMLRELVKDVRERLLGRLLTRAEGFLTRVKENVDRFNLTAGDEDRLLRLVDEGLRLVGEIRGKMGAGEPVKDLVRQLIQVIREVRAIIRGS